MSQERQYIAYLADTVPIMLWGRSTEHVRERCLATFGKDRRVLRIVPLGDNRQSKPKRKYFKTAALPEGLRVGLACSQDVTLAPTPSRAKVSV